MSSQPRKKRCLAEQAVTPNNVSHSSQQSATAFNLFINLPQELRNQIYYDVFKSEQRVNPAATKPPGFLYTCRYVWLDGKSATSSTLLVLTTIAFALYYGSNHFVMIVNAESIKAVTTYLNTILCKLNDPERRAVVPVEDFDREALQRFGSAHLLMNHKDVDYDKESLDRLNKIWNRAFHFHKYDSIAKFTYNLQLIVAGRRFAQNSRVRDRGLIAWRTRQQEMRLEEEARREEMRLEEEARREEEEVQQTLCRSVQCLCEYDDPRDRSETCRRCNPPQGYCVKGLHDRILIDGSVRPWSTDF